MNFRFKKIEFTVDFKEEKGGALVTLSRDKNPLAHRFYSAKGRLYMLSKGKWVTLDSVAIATSKRSTDAYDICAEALLTGMMKLPIGVSAVHFDQQERRVIETVVYDMTAYNKVTWLSSDHMYYMGNGKMVAVTGSSVVEYSLPEPHLDIRKNLFTIPQPLSDHPQTPKPATPRLVISPSPTNSQAPSPTRVLVQTNVVQKRSPPKKTVLPPLGAAFDYPNSDKGKMKSFYEMVDRRAQLKRDNPNWRQEEYPNYEEEHEKCMKLLEEEIEKKELEKMKRKKELEEEKKLRIVEIEQKRREIRLKKPSNERRVPILANKGKQEVVGVDTSGTETDDESTVPIENSDEETLSTTLVEDSAPFTTEYYTDTDEDAEEDDDDSYEDTIPETLPPTIPMTQQVSETIPETLPSTIPMTQQVSETIRETLDSSTLDSVPPTLMPETLPPTLYPETQSSTQTVYNENSFDSDEFLDNDIVNGVVTYETQYETYSDDETTIEDPTLN